MTSNSSAAGRSEDGWDAYRRSNQVEHLPMPPPPVACSPEELRELLRPLAARLIWWQPAQQSLRHPDRVIAQVLELGTFEDGEVLRQALGDRRLAQVLKRAEPGWFSPRSWTDWQQKLGLADSGSIPPLPRRGFGA
jgi:hypothetical protein